MRPSGISASTVAALALSVSLLLLGLTAPPASALGHDPGARWASAASATIRPGVQMFTAGAQCTGGFVFTDDADRVYVGYAAHCAAADEASTDGCTTATLPLGTAVRLADGATAVTRGTTVGHGTLAYSSWSTMQRLGTSGAGACRYNDLALVRVDPADVAHVNPSVPWWGGPVGLSSAGAPTGSRVFSWGRSSLRPTSLLSPRTGVSVGGAGNGWSWTVYTATPGIAGDSGSGFLDAQGRAVGVLSTLTLAPLAASNGVGDLGRELEFARAHSGISGLRLVPGTVPFAPLP